jgi:hypothetical protein
MEASWCRRCAQYLQKSSVIIIMTVANANFANVRSTGAVDAPVTQIRAFSTVVVITGVIVTAANRPTAESSELNRKILISTMFDLCRYTSLGSRYSTNVFGRPRTIHRTATVIPPFLMGSSRRTYAAAFSFIAGVIPPMPMLGRSLL